MKLWYLLLFIGLFGCDKDQTIPFYGYGNPKQINYLALGDSYTIGESVCTTCRFPEQLKASLQASYPNNSFLLQVIAKTGWTTTNLLSEINLVNPSTNFDLVTLLIGVNNQYQNKPFSLYETEFPQLVTKAIALAKGDKSNVIVVSIPDYAYTPFGQGAINISTAIDQYNAFAQNYCAQNEIAFVNITDITRLGLSQPELVANDGLHPSELAYSKFVERIIPSALTAIGN
ncbi:MAG: SGNH/GDSL hydrolase family protein [Flavobacterium sp.]|nr:SGNH/GDSL hydrolase family protein [Flavobacterium sp.]